MTDCLLKVINRITPLRMSPEHERLGADFVEHGIRWGANDGGLPLIGVGVRPEIAVAAVTVYPANANVVTRRSAQVHPHYGDEPVRHSRIASLTPVDAADSTGSPLLAKRLCSAKRESVVGCTCDKIVLSVKLCFFETPLKNFNRVSA